jgi:hypothetical protein
LLCFGGLSNLCRRPFVVATIVDGSIADTSLSSILQLKVDGDFLYFLADAAAEAVTFLNHHLLRSDF